MDFCNFNSGNYLQINVQLRHTNFTKIMIVVKYVWNTPQNLNKKTKLPHYRPGVAQRVGRGIALLFHDCGTRRG